MAPALRGLAVLLGCQVAGELLSSASHAPLPGPVVGLLILLGWLVWRGGVTGPVRQAANALLGSMGLLYVPAGVGIITQIDVLRQNWLSVSVALLVSIPLGMAVTGLLMQRLDRVLLDPPS